MTGRRSGFRSRNTISTCTNGTDIDCLQLEETPLLLFSLSLFFRVVSTLTFLAERRSLYTAPAYSYDSGIEPVHQMASTGNMRRSTLKER